ncbi:dihydrofolate reductase family protein [Rhodocytophaga rosea]|uniref:Dihydrofolate reductase family protein n=1 Tax=Rhodocytophaga rosea TaxID=2704465 RepID=A0A6C0GHX6_9BACT|nr:dihydrofolate reductase family protein [Rhodocytophaga rosea]QHT67303.1 dihydrofolate reductase family protein [Rhodocytophaga rosea]
MRKLKLEVQLSIDGFAAGAEGKTDWMLWHWQPEWNWDKPLQDFHTELQTSSDTVLLGKNMASGDFYRHWQQIAGSKENPQQEFANAIINMKRFMFSRKLKKSPWKDVELLKETSKKRS